MDVPAARGARAAPGRRAARCLRPGVRRSSCCSPTSWCSCCCSPPTAAARPTRPGCGPGCAWCRCSVSSRGPGSTWSPWSSPRPRCCWPRRDPVLAGAMAALGTAAKGWPVVLGLLFLRQRRWLAGAVVTGLGVALLSTLLLGGSWAFLRNLSGRGIQVESTLALPVDAPAGARLTDRGRLRQRDLRGAGAGHGGAGPAGPAPRAGGGGRRALAVAPPGPGAALVRRGHRAAGHQPAAVHPVRAVARRRGCGGLGAPRPRRPGGPPQPAGRGRPRARSPTSRSRCSGAAWSTTACWPGRRCWCATCCSSAWPSGCCSRCAGIRSWSSRRRRPHQRGTVSPSSRADSRAAVRSQVHADLTHSRPASPMRRRRAGSPRAGPPPPRARRGPWRPAAGRSARGAPPRRCPRPGRRPPGSPAAAASSSTMPSDSVTRPPSRSATGRTNRSAAAYSAGQVARRRHRPRTSTPASPARGAAQPGQLRPARRPATSRAAGCRRSSSGHTASRRACPLRGTARDTQRTTGPPPLEDPSGPSGRGAKRSASTPGRQQHHLPGGGRAQPARRPGAGRRRSRR